MDASGNSGHVEDISRSFSFSTIPDSLSPLPRLPTFHYSPSELHFSCGARSAAESLNCEALERARERARELWARERARELWARERAWELWARQRVWELCVRRRADYSGGERARYEQLSPFHVRRVGFTLEGNLTHREEPSAYRNEAMSVGRNAMDYYLQVSRHIRIPSVQSLGLPSYNYQEHGPGLVGDGDSSSSYVQTVNLGAHNFETFERDPYGLGWIHDNHRENCNLDAITGLAGDRDSPSRNILSGVTEESTRLRQPWVSLVPHCSLSLGEIGRRFISVRQNLGAFLSRGTDTRVDEAAAITSSSTSEKFKLSSAFALASLAFTLSFIYGLYSVVLARKTEERDHPLLMHSINLAIPIIGCSMTIVVLSFFGLRQGRRLLKVVEALFIVTVVCMLLGLVLGYMVLTK